MTSVDLVGSLRLSWELTPVGFPEVCQFGVHTGARDEDDFDDIIAAMDTFAGGMSGLLSPSTYNRYVISRWASGPGFTGYHQARADLVAISTGGGDLLPHQLTAVVGVVNLSEVSVELGRRRNRTNIGPLRTATMDTSGRMTTTTASTLGDQFEDLHVALEAIVTVGVTPAHLGGLCVSSPTEGTLMEGNQLRVGRRYDILRSRAEKTPETPVLTTLEVI
jgi:hypothetical protein